MTDLEKFIELYKSVGVEVVARDANRRDADGNDEGERYEIKLHVNALAKIFGCTAFETVLFFDKDEKFLYQVVWE